jgi:hypothetical protein
MNQYFVTLCQHQSGLVLRSEKTNKRETNTLGWNALAYVQYPSLFANLSILKTMWI